MRRIAETGALRVIVSRQGIILLFGRKFSPLIDLKCLILINFDLSLGDDVSLSATLFRQGTNKLAKWKNKCKIGYLLHTEEFPMPRFDWVGAG
jgi:hypothetical protein